MRRADGVSSEVIDERAVLVDPKGREVLTLNRVGTLVWDELLEDHDQSYLVERLAARFPDIPRQRIETDVGEFLAALRQAGLLTG